MHLRSGIRLCILFFVLFVCQLSVAQQQSSAVWVSDNGDGTYKNPVLHADYSDPDVIRVGEDYYMIASSFNCMPGLPVLHSKDLVNWKLINHALRRLQPDEVYRVPQHGKGVWAPSLNYRNGFFYIYYPDPDSGIFMIRSNNPAGIWSDPVLVLAGKGYIDPTSYWDDDGQAYLTVAWAASRAGVNSLLTIFKMKPDGTAVTDEGKHVYDGHDRDHTVEGPKLYKRNGFYYMLPPAGGVTNGWQLALRAKNIYGPYERRIVLAQGTTSINGPHQGSLVRTQKGEYWFLHFQDKGVYGRVLHLQPVQWKNDWPVIGIDSDDDGTGEPVMSYRKPNVGKSFPVITPAETDEFNSDTLGLQWQWQANPKLQWSALLRNSGYLRLFAYPSDTGRNLWSVPNLLLQKFPAPSFTADVKIKWTIEWDVWQQKKAGLLIMGNDYAYLAISKNETGFRLSQVSCKDALRNSEEQINEEQPLKNSEVYLRVSVSAPDATCVFSYSEDGLSYKTIGKSFIAKPELWVGAKLGLFAVAVPGIRIGGYADIDWFRISKR